MTPSKYEIAVFRFMWKHRLLPLAHLAGGRVVSEHPPTEVRLERLRMLNEELAELAAAMHEEAPLHEVADALGDLLYVLVGTFLDYGVPVDPVFEEIHRSNMTKEARPDAAPNVKPTKGPGYEPPRLQEVLASCTKSSSKVQ